MTFRDWMCEALYHPQHGYYVQPRPRWGREGDYRTSPEVSSLFSRTFARSFASLHEALGSPVEWTIREAGGGNGDFALECLQTLRERFPKVFDATRWLFDELSQDSSMRARGKLADFGEKLVFVTTDKACTTPCGIVFSNELIDAMPVHRVIKHNGALKEFYVTADDHGRFGWLEGNLSSPALDSYFGDLGIELSEGQVSEVNLEVGSWMTQATASFEKGYVVTVDYGDQASRLYDPIARPTGTLRAFRNHRHVEDILASPGEQDLTATVCWTDLIRQGSNRGAQVASFERQDQFLLRNGLLDELELAMKTEHSMARQTQLTTAAREMILPSGMADSFQVLVQAKR